MDSHLNRFKSPILEIHKSEKFKNSVLGFGHFNSVHTGHIRYLKHAKEIGQTFIVCIMKSIEGDARNVFSQLDRAESVSQLGIADAIILLEDNSLFNAVEKLDPKSLVLGKEYENNSSDDISSAIKFLKKKKKKIIYHAGDINYASSDLLLNSESQLKNERKKQFIKALNRQNISQQKLIECCTRFQKSNLLVIGDSIVDQYNACEALGMSAEAPVIVVKELEQKSFIGGAAIVASHIASLGSNCHFISVVGDDEQGKWLKKILSEQSIESQLYIENKRPTTLKKRYIVENQKLFRVSRLANHMIENKTIAKIINYVEKNAKLLDGIVISDFVYGVITPDLLLALRDIAKKENLFLFGDLQCSSQVGNISKMRNFDLLCPNEKEARIALQDNENGLDLLCQKMIAETGCKNLIMKLAADGVLVYSKDKNNSLKIQAFPALSVNPVDVTGAGDSMLAILSASITSGSSLIEAAALASYGASLVVESLGNQPVTIEGILERIKNCYSI